MFPEGFLWGAATSAHQIEGSPTADGAGPSIWDRFAATPGRTHGGDHARVACDHYRRWEGDVALLQGLGVNAYRFSVAWGRVLPDGTGRVNPAGLGFYDRLVDALLTAGITPHLTLYHWDLPAALDDRGGWLNRDVAGWFADYARVVHGALGDRVRYWTTINEPWVVMDGGYMEGTMAPGHRVLAEAPRVAHHLNLAHGTAARALRAEGAEEVGLVVNLEPKYPATDSEADRAAAARADAYMNHVFLDPVLLGRYPERLPGMFGDAWYEPPAADFDAITAPLDYVGLNYYTRAVVRADPAVPVHGLARVPQPQHAHTEMGWEVFPAGLTDTLRGMHERYGAALPPVYVTENGSAFYDPPVALADPHPDPLRVAYLRDHLGAVRDAIRAGVDVRGYFAWSLLDNFEWAAGYAKRFGLVHVDFATQRRTPKASARFYEAVVRSNGAALDAP